MEIFTLKNLFQDAHTAMRFLIMQILIKREIDSFFYSEICKNFLKTTVPRHASQIFYLFYVKFRNITDDTHAHKQKNNDEIYVFVLFNITNFKVIVTI